MAGRQHRRQAGRFGPAMARALFPVSSNTCAEADEGDARPCAAAARSDGPTYLRLLRGQVPTVLEEYDYSFELGKAKCCAPARTWYRCRAG
jgi:transketolase C-terminal domain/subunit